jgi:threonine dehydrogenase-like Zn-dependent dehydrogenase
MRETIIVPANKLHRSDTLALEQLALVETLGIGAHAVDRAGIEPGEWALVIGAGPIGLATMQFARAAGARVIALDIEPDRLAFCRDKMGVEAAVPGGDEALEQVRGLTGGDLPTVVFDATGSAASMMGAFPYCASGGRLVYVGLVLSDITFHDPDFHRKELTLLATRNSTGRDFTRIIGLLESGAVDTAPWITHRAQAASLPDAFPGWLEPGSGVLKAVVEF